MSVNWSKKVATPAIGVLASLAIMGGSMTIASANVNVHRVSAPVVYRLADDQPANYPTVTGDNAFAAKVAQLTHGKIQIKVYPDAQLGDENSTIQEIQLGAINFGRINSAPLGSYSTSMGVLGLPYLFNSSSQMWRVLNGPVGNKLLSDLKTAKMVGLTFYDSGSRDFYNSKHPVKVPADLKGLTIRVQQAAMFISLVKDLGGSPTPMAYADVYNALQSGVIDGAENNLPSYYTTNHYKVAKYLTLDEHTRNPEVLLASLKTWNSLSPADQKIIKEAAVYSQGVERKAWNALVQKSLKAIKANGNVITHVNIALWRKAVQPMYTQYGKQYKQLIQEIQTTK